MSPAALELRDIRVAYAGRIALDIPHFTAEPGETLTIMGPNGSGKSTLLRLLALLEKPQSGSVIHDGLPTANGRTALLLRRQLALVMQQSLFRNASTWENVATGLRFRHVPRHDIRRRVDRWIEKLGIAHLAKQNARTLSGGEAQRANLARALVLEPSLLLLDEPFTSLDAPAKQALLDDLFEILKELQTTTVFVTHERTEAQVLADRLAVIVEGKLRQIGTPDEVFSMPISEDVAAVVGVENILTGHVVGSAAGLARAVVGGHEVAVVGDYAVGEELLMRVSPEAVSLETHPQGAVSTSARNRFEGTVRRITAMGAQARVMVDCGFPLVSLITQQSLEALRLTPGTPVRGTFKASAIHIIRRAAPSTNGRRPTPGASRP